MEVSDKVEKNDSEEWYDKDDGGDREEKKREWGGVEEL